MCLVFIDLYVEREFLCVAHAPSRVQSAIARTASGGRPITRSPDRPMTQVLAPSPRSPEIPAAPSPPSPSALPLSQTAGWHFLATRVPTSTHKRRGYSARQQFSAPLPAACTAGLATVYTPSFR